MIVLDASVLIGYLDAADAHHELATALLTREVDDDLAVNILTVAEILVAPTRTGQAEMVLDILDDLAVATLQLPAEAPMALVQLRAETQLKMPDCCVLFSARDHKARLASFDGRVVSAARDLGIDVVQA